MFSSQEILEWYNLRAKSGAPVLFKGKSNLDFQIKFDNPKMIYRGEGHTTFPFLSQEPFMEEEYVEIPFEIGSQVYFSFKDSPFSVDDRLLQKDLRREFPFDGKFGFLILDWNAHTASARTDRKYRKDYTSVEAYHKGNCLYITLSGPEGIYEISYGKNEPWGKSTEESFKKIQQIIERNISYDIS